MMMVWCMQTQAVEKLVSLLPSSLLKADDKGGMGGAQGGMGAVISVLTSEEERKRRDERQAQVGGWGGEHRA